jgi:iron complex transport system substrate-binding protein
MTGYKLLIIFLIFLALGLAMAFFLPDESRENTVSQDTASACRIISMTPSVTESLFALGCGDRVVAVTDFCSYPPEAAEKERLGGFFNPNLERLLVLKPDLIIVQGAALKIAEFCKKENIPLCQVEMSDIARIFYDIEMLGDKLSYSASAQQLCEKMRKSLEEVKERVAGLKRPRVFFSVSRIQGGMTGLTTVGGDTYLSNLIEVAGGENIFADLKQPYPQVSKETLLKRGPEIIIETRSSEELSEKQREERLSVWRSLVNLPAVETNRIYFVPEDPVLKPGPRIGQSALLLAEIIHPESADE